MPSLKAHIRECPAPHPARGYDPKVPAVARGPFVDKLGVVAVG